MPIARSKLVVPTLTRWYHCISKVVRGAHLLGSNGASNRKTWLEIRLKQLADIYAVSVGSYAILDNHFHILLRLDPDVAANWTAAEVVERWFRLCPPRGSDRKPLAAEKRRKLFEEKVMDLEWVATIRARLSSLSWFMKSLKEPLARLVNKTEGCTGAFFEGRFKSIAVLDEEAMLSMSAYIDLNPLAAGVSGLPENSSHTSIKARVDNVRKQGKLQSLRESRAGSIAGSKANRGLEDRLWLVPIEDRRRLDSNREGMLETFTLGNYLALIDYTSRLLREGKANLSAEVADIFQRLDTSVESWQARLEQLKRGKMVGRFIAASRQRLHDAAEKLGVHHAPNLNGCPA